MRYLLILYISFFIVTCEKAPVLAEETGQTIIRAMNIELESCKTIKNDTYSDIRLEKEITSRLNAEIKNLKAFRCEDVTEESILKLFPAGN